MNQEDLRIISKTQAQDSNYFILFPPRNPPNFLDDIFTRGTEELSHPFHLQKADRLIEAGWSSLELVLVGVELNGLISPWMATVLIGTSMTLPYNHFQPIHYGNDWKRQ